MRIYSFPDYAWEDLLPDTASLDRAEPEPRLEGFPGSYWERSNKAWERVNGAVLTESIQDTRHVIHSFADSEPRNKKPVSDETCPRIYPGGQCFNSLIENRKSKIENR
ncbi:MULTISPECIES: hypothetical protein [unclassified Microcoleus]|uniref:hypothetical protein n=1 Tax=unclassified Microcoleus TaxID=2642155 RepID=UPI002FD4D4C3